MKVFKESNRLPIKMWCDEIESNAIGNMHDYSVVEAKEKDIL
jgi:hypothetical protein